AGGEQAAGHVAGGARAGARAHLGGAGVMTKVLALDYGSARTGVAVSDPTGTIARPVTTIARVDDAAGFDELVALVRGEEPELVLVGLPLPLRGPDGEQAGAGSGGLSRCGTSDSPPCLATATTPARRHTCCRAISSGAASPRSRRRRRAAGSRLGRLRHRQLGAADDDGGRAPSSAEAVPDRLPGGLHAPPDGCAREGGREDRRARTPPQGSAQPARLSRCDDERRRPLFRPKPADEPRGLPLPGDL